MARTSQRERPDQETVLWPPIQKDYPACGHPMRVRYENRRTVVTLSGTQRLCLKIRRCEQAGCARQDRPYRPEAEGKIALAQHEFGLDVIMLTGVQRLATTAAYRRSIRRYADREWISPRGA